MRKKDKRFIEDLDMAVFTTKYVIWGNSPILFVFHFDDGYWQFSGNETNMKDDDYKTISLKNIIKIDPSVLEVADLPYNWEAYRESLDSSWQIREQSDKNE